MEDIMKLTRDNIGRMPLDNFVKKVAGIYHIQDEKRSIWDIWLHASHHAASIGEEARKYKPGEKLLAEIADFSMWLFTFVGKTKEPIGSPSEHQDIEVCTIRTNKKLEFSDIIWNKYPRICPVCFWRRINSGIEISDDNFHKPCDCLIHEVESRDQSHPKDYVERLRDYAKQYYEHKPISVDQWQDMFKNIYQANLRHLSLIDIAFHLLEEMGEVCDAMSRMYTYNSKEEFCPGEPSWRQRWLENEIADVSSWLFTLVNSLELIPEIAQEFSKFAFDREVFIPERITLSRIIWHRYGDDRLESLYCPHTCKKQVCECPIYLVRTPKGLAKLKDYTVDILT